MIRVVWVALLGLMVASRCGSAEEPNGFTLWRQGDMLVERLPAVAPADLGPIESVPAPAAEPSLSWPTLGPDSRHRHTRDLPLLDDKILLDGVRSGSAAGRVWQGGMELGLDGSSGNSNTFNIRAGGDVRRQTEKNIFTLDLDYYKSVSGSDVTAHQAYLEWRNNRVLRQSRWTWFVHGTVEYDEFNAFDTRVTLNTGTGYYVLKDEAGSLMALFGGGWSREFNGPDDAFVPELTYGLQLEHQLSKRQRLVASSEYFPDVTDFQHYRIDSKAGWEILLDEEMNLSLKLSAHDRYDSTANGVRPNDLDYSAVLLWKF